MRPLLVIAIAAIAFAGVAAAADLEDHDWHYGEVDEFRETGIGGTRLTHSVLFAPRFFSVSHILGRDDTFNRRALLGIDFLTLRYEALIEHRLDRNTSLMLRPTTSIGWGYLSVENHELFQLETLGSDVERRSDLSVQNVVFDLGIHAGVRFGSWEPYFDYRLVHGIRSQKVETSEVLYVTPGSGVIDRVADQDRQEEDQATLHAWGLGLALHFGDEPWNYSFGMHVRPFNPIHYKDNTTSLWGAGFEFRADSLRLTDDSALALIFRWDFWFPDDEINDAHHFEIGVGVRFS
ncbi:MAG: hypothetical protein KDB07_11670 [Planctomycetes bacterium]|nr:hypothetical protein [Planctomycetota bacterium]